ncbi:MAG: response regulator [Methanoregula sp.]
MDDSILIVDDSPSIVDDLVALLKRKCFKPIAAHGGDEAISILSTHKPDLILLEIMMEPMDGWETLEKIKANPETHNLPVLMFSAKKISPEEAQEHSLNIENFVSKPVNPAQLLDSMRCIFERRCSVKLEATVAKDAGLDATIIGEYTALRKSIDFDRNLLEVLKNSSGINIPGRVVPEDVVQAINKLDRKITTDELRLKEINGTFAKGG